MAEKFGIYAVNLKLKVTNNPKVLAKVVIIPCSMGFQQQDKTWVNEWIDVVVFAGELYGQAQKITKGDQITVGGRLSMKEYNGKKSWQILADSLGGQVASDGRGPDEDVGLDDMPEIPF
jgi:single-stranded DNA-binding protein